MKYFKVSMLLPVIALLLFGNVQAQRITKNDLKVFEKSSKEHPLLEDDADFKATNVPSKWSGETGVILAHKTSFNFDKKGPTVAARIGRGLLGVLFAPATLGASLFTSQSKMYNSLIVEETERRKIVLQDKFAVDQYSFVYFRNLSSDAFAARVIKKDGAIQPVDFTNAVYVSNMADVPGNFKGYTDGGYGYNGAKTFCKVAIPDLQEGDMIEYEFFHTNTQNYLGNINYKEFEPVYYLCNRELPVLKQVIEVTTDEKNFIGYRSLKGSPGFGKPTVKGDFKTYRWEDADRDKLKDTRYVNELVELPSIKFQVIYASNRKQDFIWFKDQESLDHVVTNDELTLKAKQFWFGFESLDNTGIYSDAKSDKYTTKDMFKDLKKKGITDMANDEYIKNVYYTIRSYTTVNEWSDFTFARILAGLLEKKGIPYEVVVSTSNFRTSISDIAFNREIIWGIKSGNKYYFNSKDHQNPGELSTALSGNAAIIFPSDQKSKDGFKALVLPSSDTTQNVISTLVNASLDETQNGFTVKKEVEVTGFSKEAIMDDILALTPYMENDPRNYGGSSMWENYSAAAQERMTTEWNERKKQWKEDKPKQMKEMVENEYGFTVKKYDNFKLIQDGRSFKKQSLKYTEDFTLEETVTKAGDDLIVALPAMISQQVKIKKEERDRLSPINFQNPKTFRWRIAFPVPAGYSVLGLEALNQKVANISGSFNSTAVLEGNTVVLNVKKTYNAKFFETGNWKSVLEFLDAAYKFCQAKIILKKA